MSARVTVELTPAEAKAVWSFIIEGQHDENCRRHEGGMVGVDAMWPATYAAGIRGLHKFSNAMQNAGVTP